MLISIFFSNIYTKKLFRFTRPTSVSIIIVALFALELSCTSNYHQITIPNHIGTQYQPLATDIFEKRKTSSNFMTSIIPHANFGSSTYYIPKHTPSNMLTSLPSQSKAEFTSGDGVVYVCDVINGEYENCMPKTANAGIGQLSTADPYNNIGISNVGQTESLHSTPIGQSTSSKAEFTSGDGVIYVCDVINGEYENCMPKTANTQIEQSPSTATPSIGQPTSAPTASVGQSTKAEFTSGDGVIYVCDVINGEYENCMPKTANAAPTTAPPAPTAPNKAETTDDKGNIYQCDLIQGQYTNCVLTKKAEKIEFKKEKDERGNEYKCKYINGIKAECELTKKAKPKIEYKNETDERGNQFKCKYTDGEKGECKLTKKAKIKYEKMKDPEGNEYKCEVWNGKYENCVLSKAAPKKYINIKDGNGVEYKCEENKGQLINCKPVKTKKSHRSKNKK